MVIPLSPIDRRPNYRWETPPPNILRDTSPSGRGWKAPPDPVTVVDAFDPSTGVSAYSASRFKSLVEFGGYYSVRNMSPMEIRTHNQQGNNYALEAASALGHRDVVAIILNPEETFIHLLRTRDLKIIKQMLDKQAVTSVSTTMLTSAYDVDTLVLLLEDGPSYIVTSATIDAVQTGQDS